MSLWSRCWHFLLGIICPSFCVSCGRLGPYLCDQCGEDILLCAPTAAHHLTLPLATCYLDRVQALAVYQGAIKDLIAAFKYQHVKDLGAVGAYYLYQFCQLPAPAAAINFVSFVPIHRRRYRERGFNQSRLLAQHFAARAHLSFSPLLRRDLYREKQALSKDKAERQAKVRGVFSLSAAISPAALQGATVLLIDDVVTTGATLNECARVLKKAGVSQVYALCLAHGM